MAIEAQLAPRIKQVVHVTLNSEKFFLPIIFVFLSVILWIISIKFVQLLVHSIHYDSAKSGIIWINSYCAVNF